jgi:TrmH family RNA methyltransferase
VLGARNPKVKDLRRLASSRRSRATAGCFVVEGPTLVAELLDTDLDVVDVFHEPGADPALLARASARAAVHPVHEGVLDAAADAVASQGIVAVAAIPAHDLASVAVRSPVLVLDGIADPGNAGTLVRVAEACGFGAVLFTAGSVDPWSPKAVRASAGSVLRVPVMMTGEGAAVLDELRAGGRRCVGTRATDAPAYTEVTFPPDTTIVLGNEAHGLDPAIDEHVDVWVRIPMAGRVESLNVAVARAVLAFEVRRQNLLDGAGA